MTEVKLNFKANSAVNFYLPASSITLLLRTTESKRYLLFPKRTLGKDWGEFTIKWSIATKEKVRKGRKMQAESSNSYNMDDEDIYDTLDDRKQV